MEIPLSTEVSEDPPAKGAPPNVTSGDEDPMQAQPNTDWRFSQAQRPGTSGYVALSGRGRANYQLQTKSGCSHLSVPQLPHSGGRGEGGWNALLDTTESFLVRTKVISTSNG
ncbi:uncharacterized protein LOC132710496 isoform X2 [Pantherophis guttatus]|uniref:Uncharacterized protein LOC132710450 isoform X2 n=1 Tax=Pantherophis guttatus TaxID=94885 RepID=A0ABM3Z351_PANGU|nr:uncharacterized protein LOC132710450 isoform X2 [Pantherophis guttatus]XP_060542790.1 uncharacterized protein LOC132710496 isoform X2 [Pantherophis guttatus]